MSEGINQLTAGQVKTAIPKRGTGFSRQMIKSVKDMDRGVYIKIPHNNKNFDVELSVLPRLMAAGMDQRNICKFLDISETLFGKGLVFESLDVNLRDYCRVQPISLCDVRAVIDQMATALEGLQTLGLIHTDLRLDNIMVCDRTCRPLQLKLIDFGRAMYCQHVSQGDRVSRVNYRAPEVILGLPFTEAIDVWALGVVAVNLLLGIPLFPRRTQFETIKVIVKLLGQPPDHVLQEGLMTDDYFKINDRGWIEIMTRMEYIESNGLDCWDIKNSIMETYGSLEEVVKVYYKVRDPEEDEELDLCIDLLNKMLEVNAENRITPAQIHQHPFISNYRVESAAEEEPGVMTVKEAEPENRTPLTEQDQELVSEPGRFEQECVRQVQSRTSTAASPASTPRVITVQLATPENTTPFVDSFQQCVGVDGESEKTPATTERVCLGKSRTSTPISPWSKPEIMILKPATSENTTAFTEDVKQCVSVTSGLQRTAATTEDEPLVVDGNTTRLLEDQPSGSAWLESDNTSSGLQSDLFPSAKKKKKNCFRRILSWMRKQFSCCLNIKEE